MEKKQISMFDVLIETHAGLDRQGPGSPEMMIKALGFLNDFNNFSKVADLGCGNVSVMAYR